MNNTHDLKKYKESLAILPHLEAIIRVLNLTESALKHYNSYIPVIKILNSIRDQKALLEIHRIDYKKIKETKGRK